MKIPTALTDAGLEFVSRSLLSFRWTDRDTRDLADRYTGSWYGVERELVDGPEVPLEFTVLLILRRRWGAHLAGRLIATNGHAHDEFEVHGKIDHGRANLDYRTLSHADRHGSMLYDLDDYGNMMFGTLVGYSSLRRTTVAARALLQRLGN